MYKIQWSYKLAKARMGNCNKTGTLAITNTLTCNLTVIRSYVILTIATAYHLHVIGAF